MKKVSIVLSIILGTILHFLFEWSGCNNFIGLFSATNESIWEHLKLSFFPILIIGILEYFIIGKNNKNFITSKMIAVVFAMLFTIVTFYTYSGIIGRSYFVVDIIIFILSIIFAEIISYKVMNSRNLHFELYSGIIIIIIAILFAVFTTNPPRVPLFQDPVTKAYGSKCCLGK